MASDKDTIYIDIDDEITGIIDKVKTSGNKVVALVLPKRATVFQSIVNMKLLKRAADGSKKNLVLITGEAGLLPLAGAAGIHVAKTLNSKPEIPAAPDLPDEAEDTVTESGEDVPINADKSVGELAAATTGADGVETVMLDDEDLPPEAEAQAVGSQKSKTFEPPKKGKNKKLAIPNFERFRLLLILGAVVLILLLGGLVFATVALPKARIAIKTNATNVDVNLGLNLSTTAKQLDEETGTLPAKLASHQKVYTQQVPTTGQKNNGNRASGSVRLDNCSRSDDITVPAGTGLSSDGNTYITQESVTLKTSSYDKGKCEKNRPENVDVVAQNPGSAYNGANTFSVPSYPDVSGTAASSISGGTDNIVQTVNQNDINNAKSKITVNEAEIKKALKDQIKKDRYYAIEASYSAGAPSEATSANVGQVASTVTVTQTITYTMFGVQRNDLKQLVDGEINSQIDPEQQAILDDGIARAVYNVDNLSATAAQLTMSVVAVAGPDLNVQAIKEEAAGQKPGPIKDKLSRNPDVESVDIKLSPFWVGTIPKKTDRIKVDIAKPDSAKASDNGGDR